MSYAAALGMATETATYLYCVVKSAKAPALAKLPSAPKGLAGAGKVRLLDAGDGYHVVVASAPLSRYSAEKIDARLRDIDWVAERAAEHETVVEHASAWGTVVPMKLFTLFTSDERALAHVTKTKKTLDRVVARIAGSDEWGVRILFDEVEAARVAAEESSRAKPTSGTSFLARKKEQQDVRRTLTSRAADEVDALYTDLEKLARRAQRRAAPSRELAGRVMLDAVFLVPRTSVKKLKSTVAATAERLARQGFHVTLTGPWPAYSFIGGR